MQKETSVWRSSFILGRQPRLIKVAASKCVCLLCVCARTTFETLVTTHGFPLVCGHIISHKIKEKHPHRKIVACRRTHAPLQNLIKTELEIKLVKQSKSSSSSYNQKNLNQPKALPYKECIFVFTCCSNYSIPVLGYTARLLILTFIPEEMCCWLCGI